MNIVRQMQDRDSNIQKSQFVRSSDTALYRVHWVTENQALWNTGFWETSVVAVEK